MLRRFPILMLTLGLASLAQSIVADQIILKDGTVIQGQAECDGDICHITAAIGKFEIPKADVVAIIPGDSGTLWLQLTKQPQSSLPMDETKPMATREPQTVAQEPTSRKLDLMARRHQISVGAVMPTTLHENTLGLGLSYLYRLAPSILVGVTGGFGFFPQLSVKAMAMARFDVNLFNPSYYPFISLQAGYIGYTNIGMDGENNDFNPLFGFGVSVCIMSFYITHANLSFGETTLYFTTRSNDTIVEDVLLDLELSVDLFVFTWKL